MKEVSAISSSSSSTLINKLQNLVWNLRSNTSVTLGIALWPSVCQRTIAWPRRKHTDDERGLCSQKQGQLNVLSNWKVVLDQKRWSRRHDILSSFGQHFKASVERNLKVSFISTHVSLLHSCFHSLSQILLKKSKDFAIELTVCFERTIQKAIDFKSAL